MLRKDILLIINPNASKGRGRKKAKEIQSLFRNMSRECTVAYTRAPGHAESLAKRGALYGYDTIVVAGGDGTVNETVNGIMKSGVSGVRMGIIPIGRGNDFSWMAGIPSKQKKAVELIARGISRKIDVGFCVGTEHPDGMYFVNGAGFRALLPISEISRGRVEDIASVLSPGQEITAQVISADWQRERVSLSLKNLTADPWDSVQEKYPVDSKHTGTISRVADFGLFVTLEPGIDGLVHISALENENRNTNLRVKYKTGTKMDVTVISLDPKQRRLGLCPTSSTEQDTSARIYLDNQDDSDTYNPFAALLKKK